MAKPSSLDIIAREIAASPRFPYEATARAIKNALRDARYQIVDMDAPANGNDADGNYHSRY